MTQPRKAAVLLLSITGLLVSPSPAIAKPVSTHVLTTSVSQGPNAMSLHIEVGESGAVAVDLDVVEFAMIACESGVASRTTVHQNVGPVESVTFTVDRKLTTYQWQGNVTVATTITDSCTGEVLTSASEWEILVEGSSSSRLSRNRVGGVRILSNVLDTVQVSTPVESYGGAAILRELISTS